jgi:hypothetical protein
LSGLSGLFGRLVNQIDNRLRTRQTPTPTIACRSAADDWQEPEFDGAGLAGLFGFSGFVWLGCVFRSALGWTAEKAEDVRHRLLEAVLVQDTAFLGADDYGQRYAVDFPVQGLDAIVTIRSLWIMRHGEDFLRFTSCYVL